jgi:CelD/BcsL family acetyltransferase involved in cellulose biosynthesis
VIRSIPQLEAIREEWDALSAPLRSPLLDHDWFLSCAEAFYRDGDLRIVTTRHRQKLVGAAPLVTEHSSGGSRLRLLGVSKLYEPSSWLTGSAEALPELIEQALGIGHPMILQRIPADSPVALALASTPRHRAFTVVRSTASSLAVDTTGSWDEYHGSLSSQITINLRRVRKKAEAAFGRITVERLSPRPPEVDASLEMVSAVEGSGWKGRLGSSLASRDDLLDFFRRYCRRAAEKGRLRVSTLRFGADVAAVELSIEAYQRMWQLKIGYQDSLSGYYPGLQLTEFSIRDAFERGLEGYEFLGSAATWEERWRPETRHFQTLAVYPVTAPGLIGACRDALNLLRRRVLPAQAAP